jgi:hypothetical protein
MSCPRRHAAGPDPIAFQLGLVARRLRSAYALLSTARPDPPSARLKGSSPFRRLAPADEPPDAGAARPAPAAGPPPPRQEASNRLRRFRPTPGPLVLDHRPGVDRAAPGAPPATGACAREGGAIPSRQLPRMRRRSDRGMSQGGWTAVRLGRYLGLLPSQS